MKIQHFIFLSIFLCLGFTALSQNQDIERCHTSQKVQTVLDNHPEIAAQRAILEHETQVWINENQDISSREVITLPVVVHVIWNAANENISEAQIQSQIDVLNEDYRAINENLTIVPNAFQNLIADTEIEFCLASINPSGNATTGITRTQTTINTIGNTDNYFQTNLGGHDPWDNNSYINIWVCAINPSLLGFAWPPGTAFPPAADGMVIAPKYFGRTGTAANSFPYNEGRTTTHEMGHYLNLQHLWGPTNGGCNQDDFVTDTPLQQEEHYGCPNFPITDNCTSSGSGVMFMNYMDYVNDLCMAMFTPGQKARMLAAINGPRSGLLTSNGCGFHVGNQEIINNALELYPNPASVSIQITANEEIGSGTLPLSIVDIQGRTLVNQMITFSANQANVDVSQLATGMYFVRIQLDDKILVSKFLVN